MPDLPERTNADVVVVANPNNPDGRRWPPLRLNALREHLAARGGLLVVDEAFADIDPSLSMAPHTGPPGLLVLRSFGKFYGLAGVRLGFAIGAAEDISRLAAWLGPWAVSGPAIEIGIEALSDESWADATRARITELAGQLEPNSARQWTLRHRKRRPVHPGRAPSCQGNLRRACAGRNSRARVRLRTHLAALWAAGAIPVRASRNRFSRSGSARRLIWTRGPMPSTTQTREFLP